MKAPVLSRNVASTDRIAAAPRPRRPQGRPPIYYPRKTGHLSENPRVTYPILESAAGLDDDLTDDLAAAIPWPKRRSFT